MTKANNDYKLVYRMNYAMELIKMGHNVFSTSPNPQRPQLTMWVFEYDDTTEIKYWEGKIQKLGQEELTEWGGLVCPISFLPGTPKYIKKDSILGVQTSQSGKSYPFNYPYTYSQTVIQNNIIDNTYFDEIPLRIIVYGKMTNPQISLVENDTNEVYSIVRFENLGIEEGEHIVIDAIQSKILLYRDGRYISAYDYVSKQSNLDSFLYAKGETKSRIVISLNPLENGYLRASYRQYTLWGRICFLQCMTDF